MEDNNSDFPDLLWSCFVNWLNTLENVGFFKLIEEQNNDKNPKEE
jgi:hypothetical protein